MRHAACALLFLSTLSASVPAAAPPSSPTASPQSNPGKVAFGRWCAECHAAGHGHPGTQQLERVRGAKLSLLESRADLEAAFVRYVVRHGQNAMPAYRPSEISDADLDLIAQYLARSPAAIKKRR